jgi:predicted HicB family RNase H-like nuclease
MVVRVDPRVRDKIRIKAARENVTMSGLVREALAHHYGLSVESPKRKSRWVT